jgi:transposase
VISDVARRHDLVPQHLWNWIKAARKGRFALPGDGLPAFVPVMSLEPGQRSEPAQDVRTTAIELVIGAVTAAGEVALFETVVFQFSFAKNTSRLNKR